MASAKKGKKSKGKTLALVDFLQETPGSVPTVPIRKSTLNWADEVEDNHDVYDPRSNKQTSVVLPTAPKASRDFDDIIDKVPQDPPYIAYLSNLPYDVDEEEIAFFFKNMKIDNMRFPKDDRAGEGPKLKGFGYVEFEDRESLLNALVMPDTTIKARRIRIEVAGDNNDRRGGRMDMNRDRGNRPDISSGDWRSGPRSENTESDSRRSGFGRDRERERERDRPDDNSMWRDGERRAPREPERNFTRSSDRFNRDERDSEFSRNRGGDREERPWNRDRNDGNDRNWSRGGDRDRERNRDDEGGFMSRRGPPTRRDPPPREESDANSEPRRRQKLVLAPRTKPVEAGAAEPATSASIFGDAKPVDTSARERQIEERLAKAGDPLPMARDRSRDRKEAPQEKDTPSHGEEKEQDGSDTDEPRPVEGEKQSVERISSHPQKNDANGVEDKDHSGDEEKQEDEKKEQEKREYEKKDGDGNKSDGGDKHKPDTKKHEKREKVEKEMPKVKQVDPPNFIANNKFAFLENEDNSD